MIQTALTLEFFTGGMRVIRRFNVIISEQRVRDLDNLNDLSGVSNGQTFHTSGTDHADHLQITPRVHHPDTPRQRFFPDLV